MATYYFPTFRLNNTIWRPRCKMSLLEAPEIYKSLTDGQIRLVRLKPGAGDAMISCTFCTVLLDSKPDYEALSYVWGNAKDQEDILLDNQMVKVGKNLEAALRYLRFEDKGRDIWVDAVCINQRITLRRIAKFSLCETCMVIREVYSYGLGRRTKIATLPWSSYLG